MGKQNQVTTLQEMEDIAKEVVHTIGSSSFFVVLLTGDLAAGKTTLTQMIGRRLGILEPMQSPSYAIVRMYPLPEHPAETLHHIDLYRLHSEDDVQGAGILDLFHNRKGLFFIEWPDHIHDFLKVIDVENQVLKIHIGLEEDRRIVDIG